MQRYKKIRNNLIDILKAGGTRKRLFLVFKIQFWGMIVKFSLEAKSDKFSGTVESGRGGRSATFNSVA